MQVLIIADNRLAVEAIRREMRHARSHRVTGFVDGRRACRRTIAHESPDVVLIDDMESRHDTRERISDARAAAPKAKILLLTRRMDVAWLAEACDAGIDGAIAKRSTPGALGMLVREVLAGNVYHALSVASGREDVPSFALTSRELEVLRLAASGSSNGRIAETLRVTEQTVKFHLSNVYRKLGVTNRTQASHFAHERGLLRSLPAPGPHEPELARFVA